MQTHLRPMSLGEILDRTAQLYRSNFLLFAGIASVYAGVLLVINLIQLGADQWLLHAHLDKQLPLVTLIFVIIIMPVVFICAGAAVAANNRAVAWVNLGKSATIIGAYKSILPRLGRYLWLMTIMAFVIYIPFVVIFTGYFVFLFTYGRAKGIFQPGQASDSQGIVFIGLITFLFFALMAAAFIYAVLMALRYSLALPASVVEDLKAFPAIRRSIELSKGSRGRIFVLALLIVVIELGLVGITQIFFLLAMFAAVKRHAEVPLWIQVAQQVVGFLTTSFIGPMYATGLTLFYYDQRIRKEGFDIEWMMEAAGMNPLPTPTPETPSPIPDTPSPTPNTPSPIPDTPSPIPDTPSPTPDTPSPTPAPPTEGSHG